MNQIKTIGMLVIVVAAITAAATVALPSMTHNAEAAACAGTSISVSGGSSAVSSSDGACSVSVTATPP